MTRKHFRIIAGALVRAQQGKKGWNLACVIIGQVLASENPRFDMAKWLAACQTGSLSSRRCARCSKRLPLMPLGDIYLCRKCFSSRPRI